MSTIARLDVEGGIVVMRAEEGYDAETTLRFGSRPVTPPYTTRCARMDPGAPPRSKNAR
jgi:hypothetical protein